MEKKVYELNDMKDMWSDKTNLSWDKISNIGKIVIEILSDSAKVQYIMEKVNWTVWRIKHQTI